MARRPLLLLLVVLAAIALVPGTGVGIVWRVQGPSMEPTIPDGSIVLVDPVGPRTAGYRRGDIVILESPGVSGSYPFRTMIKRVIAVPGEVVEIDDGEVRVEGRPLDEPYLPQGRDDARPYVDDLSTMVPPGKVFVMGDHRSASLDSAVFGAIPMEDLHGRVVVIVAPGGIDVPVPSTRPGVAVVRP